MTQTIGSVPLGRVSPRSSPIDAVKRVFNRWIENVKAVFGPRASRSVSGSASPLSERKLSMTKADVARCTEYAREHMNTCDDIERETKKLCFEVLSKETLNEMDLVSFATHCDRLRIGFVDLTQFESDVAGSREDRARIFRQAIMNGAVRAPDGWFDRICNNLESPELSRVIDEQPRGPGSEIRLLFKAWRAELEASARNADGLDAVLDDFRETWCCDKSTGGAFKDLNSALTTMHQALRHAARREVGGEQRVEIYRKVKGCLRDAMPGIQQRATRFSLSQIRSVGALLGEIDKRLDDCAYIARIEIGRSREMGFQRELAFGMENCLPPGRRVGPRMDELYACLQHEDSPLRAPKLLSALVEAAQAVTHAMDLGMACYAKPENSVTPDAPTAANLKRYLDRQGVRPEEEHMALRAMARQQAPELRALRAVLNEGRGIILKQCQALGLESSAVLGELAGACRMLDYLVGESLDPAEFVGAKPKAQLSESMHMALLDTFGLIVDSKSGKISSAHEFSSTLFESWPDYVETKKSDQLKWLEQAGKKGMSVLTLPSTMFQADVSRTQFVIEGDSLSANAASRQAAEQGRDTEAQTAAGANEIEGILERLTELAGGNESFLGLIAAFANQSSFAALMGAKDDANLVAWTWLQPAYRDNNQILLVPSNAGSELTSVSGPTVALTVIDEDHVKLEFMHHVPQANAVQSKFGGEAVYLNPSTSAWHGRYAVILGRDGSARLDGPVNVYGRLSVATH
ncbi:hypothetical protein [Pandoraea iniqua]|nr:hypothetical protein [Pandoraea iniqua]